MDNVWRKSYYCDKKPNNKFMRKLLEDFITNGNVNFINCKIDTKVISPDIYPAPNVNFWLIIITIHWPKDKYNVDN